MRLNIFTIHRLPNSGGNIVVTANPVVVVIGLAILAAFLFIGCAKKPAPAPTAPVVEALVDTAPPSRVFFPRQDSAPPLPPRFFTIIYFAFDSDFLDETAEDAMRRAGGFLFEHPGYSLQVEGYADTTGYEGYNDSLSQRRADRAWKAITKIQSPRIGISTGHGERPGVPALSRRVIVRILP